MSTGIPFSNALAGTQDAGAFSRTYRLQPARSPTSIRSAALSVILPAAAFCTACSALVAPPTTMGDPLEIGHLWERYHEGAAVGEEDHDQREGCGGDRGESLFPGHMERCRPDHHHSETERSQRREPCGDADRARKDQSERCHDLRPRGDRPFDRNVLLGEYPLQSGRREQMQHRMQHEALGKQNLQDPQSNVHCMIALSPSLSPSN